MAEALGMDCPKAGSHSSKRWRVLDVTLAMTGVSAKHLPARAADVVVMAGLAGALDGGLAAGDLVVDDWAEELTVPREARRGKILSVQRIAATPAEKSALFAESHCMVVDMENAIVREWAKRHGASFYAIRAISDRSDQSLDPALLTIVDSWGRPRLLRLLRLLLLRPWLIPHLIRLGADSKKAVRRLGEAVREIVERA